MPYESHHLALEELWYVRERPFDKTVVAVKRLIREEDEYERLAAETRAKLEAAIQDMNVRRLADKAVPVAADTTPKRRRIRGPK